MSLSKAVIMGEVVRTPEKRFTTNNLAITTFAINIGDAEKEALLRVVAVGKLAETAETTLKKGVKVVVEGRLQNAVVKTTSGEEKKIVELSAQALEAVGGTPVQSASTSEEFLFEDQDVSDDLIGEDEIPF